MIQQKSPTYTPEDIMVVAASREIKDHEVAFIGTGLPMLAAYVAKAMHAPNVTMLFESGIVNPDPVHMASGVGDFPLLYHAPKVVGLSYVFGLLQRGKVDLGFLGAAEVDQYGNINSTVIGDYHHPKVRLPGSGGANDIASLAKRTVIIVPHQPRKFPENLSYLTTPGHLDGAGARQREGLKGNGPVRVITNLAVLGFDDETRKIKVESVHPGVSLQEVIEKTGFELLVPDEVKETVPPTKEEVELIRRLDPKGIYIKK